MVKETNIKNRTYYFYNDMIDIEKLASLLKIDKKSYKNIDIYYIGYIPIKKIDDHENLWSWSSIYEWNQNNTVTRNSSLKLFQPLRMKALSLKCLSYLGPFIWNGLPDDVKLSNNVNTFKLKVKNNFWTLLRKKDKDVYVYYG